MVFCLVGSSCALDGDESLSTTSDRYLSFEEWAAELPNDGSRYRYDDLVLSKDEHLRTIYNRVVTEPGALTGKNSGGSFQLWNATDRIHLSYCVSSEFGPTNYATMRLALDRASAAWESTSDLNFEEFGSGSSCSDTSGNLFNVRYFNCDKDAGILDNSTRRDYDGDGNSNEACETEREWYCGCGFPALPHCTSMTIAQGLTCAAPFAGSAFLPNESQRSARVLLIGNNTAFQNQGNFSTGMYQLMRHELGHILGFLHEFDRADFLSWYPNATCPSNSSNTLPITAYPDAYSVMSYANCVPGVVPTFLTQADMQQPPTLYGLPFHYQPIVGDFDGDGASDFLLRTGRMGNIQLDLSNTLGGSQPQYGISYPTWSWDSVAVAPYGTVEHPHAQVFSAKFHDTTYSDLVLKDDDTGILYVDYGYNGITAGGWEKIYFGYGDSTWKMASADYDGDGLADIAVKQGDTWRLDYSSYLYNGQPFGGWDYVSAKSPSNLATPTSADYDGDGRADIAIKLDDGTFRIDLAGVGAPFFYCGVTPCFQGWDVTVTGTGGASYLPVLGDFDGDNKADISMRDTSTGNWYVDYASDGFGSWAANFPKAGWGGSLHIHIPGKFHSGSDKRSDMAVKQGNMYYQNFQWSVDNYLLGSGYNGADAAYSFQH